MTLVLAVGNEAGVVLAADGVGSYGPGIGSQQIPHKKLHAIGDRIACGEVGDLSITTRLVEALRASQLAKVPTGSLTADECLEMARKAIAQWTGEYLKSVVINTALPLDGGRALLLLAGVAQDRGFAYGITWLGEHSEPDTRHYLARGSGAQSARIYLDAYEYFVLSGRPVLSLQALAARVMERVARNNMEIGGDISLMAIHRDASDEHPVPLVEMSPTNSAIRGAIEHWELLESTIGEMLLPPPAAT